MPYFAVDGAFADHPKLLALRASKHCKGAIALWTLAGSWSARHLTDGVIPHAAIPVLSGTVQEAQALVACGLWRAVEGGYSFHDWNVHNSTKAEIERKRVEGRDRVSKHRRNKLPSAPRNALQTHNERVSNSNVTEPHPIPSQLRERSDARANPCNAEHTGIDPWQLQPLWRERWDRKHPNRDPGGATHDPRKCATAQLWEQLALILDREAKATGIPWDKLYSRALDALFSSNEAFVVKQGYPPSQLVSQWLRYAPKLAAAKTPEQAELARLDAAIDQARQRGDFDAVDRLKAEVAALADQKRRAS